MFIKMNLVRGKYFIFLTMHNFTILLNILFMHLPNLFRVEAKNISGIFPVIAVFAYLLQCYWTIV